MCKLKYILCLVVSVFLSVGCKQQSAGQVEERAESKQAKQLLQGVWMDQESEMVVFKMQGDTVYFSDSTSVPAYFRVINDTLFIGDNDIKYPIVKQMPHVLWFKNAGGDVVKLVKSTDPEDANVFKRKRHGRECYLVVIAVNLVVGIDIIHLDFIVFWCVLWIVLEICSVVIVE